MPSSLLYVRRTFRTSATFDGNTRHGNRVRTWRRRSYLLSSRTCSYAADATNTVTAIRDPFGNSYGYSTCKAADPAATAVTIQHLILWSTAGRTASRNRSATKVDQKLVGATLCAQSQRRLRHAAQQWRLEDALRDDYPSVVRTTTSTRRLGLCSSIEPFADARNFVAPYPRVWICAGLIPIASTR